MDSGDKEEFLLSQSKRLNTKVSMIENRLARFEAATLNNRKRHILNNDRDVENKEDELETLQQIKIQTSKEIEDLKLEKAIEAPILQRIFVKKLKEDISKGVVKLGQCQSQLGQNILLAHGNVIGMQERAANSGKIDGETTNVKPRERSEGATRGDSIHVFLPKKFTKDEVKLGITKMFQNNYANAQITRDHDKTDLRRSWAL